MKMHDLLIMSINNLRRRKLRTVLTVLGVVIGTASIVVMVSLGIGLSERTVEVYSESRWNYVSSDSKSEPNYITDDVVEQFRHLPHVRGASPVLSFYVLMRQGDYEGHTSLKGVSEEFLK